MNNHFFNFFLEASKDLVPKHSVINLRGQNTDVDTSTVPETVTGLGSIYEFITYDTSAPNNGAQYLKVSSTSTDDTFSGSGAMRVLLEGLDENFKQISEVVPMNGTGSVSTAQRFLRLNSIVLDCAGSGEKNVGTIAVVNSAAASHTLGTIRPGEGKMHQAVFTVPANHSAYILEIQGSMSRSSAAGVAILSLITREPKQRTTLSGFFGENMVRLTHHSLSLQDDGNRIFNKLFALPIKVPQLSDILVDCTYVSANNTSVNADLSIILVNDGE